MSIRSLIIDDDPFILSLLQDKLEQYFPEIEILQTAASGAEGIELIRANQPELVFLDVEMKDMTGFEMLTKLNQVNFQIIFITSFSHYAIRAIRFNALDYILKPFDLDELKQAILRFKTQFQPDLNQNHLQIALQNLRTNNPSEEVLILHPQDGELRMPIKDILHIEGERNYSYIYLQNKRKKLVSKTMGDLEELLKDKGFFRCHKSHLVNFVHIESYPKDFSVILSSGVEIPIARRKKKNFEIWYKHTSMLVG